MSDSLNALLQGQRNATVLQGIANPSVVNPLAAISAGTQAASQVYDLRAKQANQALGDILQQSTDANGNVDFQDAQRRAALAGPIVQAGMQSYLTNNSQLQTQQLSQMAARHAFVGKLSLSGVQNPSDENVDSIIAQAKAAGAPDGAIAELTRIRALPQDQRPAQFFQHLASNTEALHQFHVGTGGTPVILNLPQGPQGATQHPVTGALTTQGGTVPAGMSPSEYASYQQWLLGQVEYPDPADPSRKKTGTRATMFNDLNVDPRQAWPGALQGAATGGTPTGGSGGTPRPSATPGGAAPGGSFGPSPNKPATGGTTFGAGKGVSAPSQADLDAQKASADQYNADLTSAGTYQQRIFPLVQAASILKSGDVTTGQGAEAFNRVKSFLQTQASNLGIDAQSIQQADFDKTAKYLQQYINMQGMSGRSDQALASAISGNPSAHISTLANQQILPVMIGMERMKQTIISDFKAQGGRPADYGSYAARWQNEHDPRAFIFDMMDGDQRKKMVAGMSPTQRAAFKATLDLVDKYPGIMGQAAMPGH